MSLPIIHPLTHSHVLVHLQELDYNEIGTRRDIANTYCLLAAVIDQVYFTVIIVKCSVHFTVIFAEKFSFHFTVIIEKFSVQFCIFFGLLITTLHKTQIGHWDTDSGVWWVGERSDETNSSPFLHQFFSLTIQYFIRFAIVSGNIIDLFYLFTNLIV